MPELTIPPYIPPLPSADDLNSQNEASVQTQNVIAEGAFLPIILGEGQVGGKIFAVDYDAATSTWTVGVAWCVGECDSIQAVYLNGEAAVSGVTRTDYLGTTSQTADATLAAAISGYTDTLVITRPGGDIGVCYSVFVYTDTEYQNFPKFVAQIRGLKYNAGAWTASPATNVSGLIQDAILGTNDSVNAASVTTVATDNSELVPPVTGSARREIGLVIDKPMPFVKWLRILAVYMSAWLTKRGDTWYFVSDRPRSTDDTLTTADWTSFRARIKDKDLIPTVVEVSYTDTTENIWRERTVSRELAGVAGGTVPRRVSRVRLPGVTRYKQAYREAQERLDKLQNFLQVTIEAVEDHLDKELGDVLSLTRGTHLSAVLFRVTAPPVKAFGGGITLQLTGYNSTDYDDSDPANPTFGDNSGSLGPGAELDDSPVFEYGALNYNPSFRRTRTRQDGRSRGAPAGWFAYGSSGNIRYLDKNVRDVIVFDSTLGIQLVGTAFPVNPDTRYRVRVMARKQNAADGSRLELQAHEYDSDLPSGVAVIATHSGGAADDVSFFVAPNRGEALTSESPSYATADEWDLTTSFAIYEGIYEPTISAQYCSINIDITNNGAAVDDVEVEWLVVYNEAVRPGGPGDLGGIIRNGAMNIPNYQSPVIRPAAMFVSWTTNDNRLSYHDDAQTIAALGFTGASQSALTTSVFGVNPNNIYRVSVRMRGNAVGANGLYFRILELDTALPDGILTLTESGVSVPTYDDAYNQTATRRLRQTADANWTRVGGGTDFENDPVSTSWQEYRGDYQPTSTARWAAIEILSGSSYTDLILVDRINVELNPGELSPLDSVATANVDVDALIKTAFSFPTNVTQTDETAMTDYAVDTIDVGTDPSNVILLVTLFADMRIRYSTDEDQVEDTWYFRIERNDGTVTDTILQNQGQAIEWPSLSEWRRYSKLALHFLVDGADLVSGNNTITIAGRLRGGGGSDAGFTQFSLSNMAYRLDAYKRTT